MSAELVTNQFSDPTPLAAEPGRLSPRFANQIAATRENLDNLERVATEHPELFELGSLIEVTREKATVFVHAGQDSKRDWKAFARKYRAANWQRQSAASSYEHFDYDGQFRGVRVCILQAEKRGELEPLFGQDGEEAA